MGSWSIWHWIVVLVVVIVVFGTKKLRNAGRDIGGAVHDFKKGMNEGTETTANDAENSETTKQISHDKKDV